MRSVNVSIITANVWDSNFTDWGLWTVQSLHLPQTSTSSFDIFSLLTICKQMSSCIHSQLELVLLRHISSMCHISCHVSVVGSESQNNKKQSMPVSAQGSLTLTWGRGGCIPSLLNIIVYCQCLLQVMCASSWPLSHFITCLWILQ